MKLTEYQYFNNILTVYSLSVLHPTVLHNNKCIIEMIDILLKCFISTNCKVLHLTLDLLQVICKEISSRNWHFMRFLENLLLSKITQ